MPLLVSSPARSIQWCASLQPGSYGFSSQKQTTGQVAQNTVRATPVYFHRPATLDRVGCEVTTAGEAGSVVRLGIYADNGNLYPGALLADCGTVPADSTGVKEITLSDLVIPAGIVWFGVATQLCPTTAPWLRGVSGSPPLPSALASDVPNTRCSVLHSAVAGALPASFTTALSGSAIGQRVFWRVKP